MMVLRPLIMMLSAAIFVSLFMPWINAPFGGTVIPWDAIGQLRGDDLQTAPPLLLVFLLSFALAALLAGLCLFGSEHKLIAVITGALPLGLLGYGLFQAQEEITRLGLPVPETGDLSLLFEQAMQFLGLGAFVYFGAAAILLLVSLFDPGRDDAR